MNQPKMTGSQIAQLFMSFMQKNPMQGEFTVGRDVITAATEILLHQEKVMMEQGQMLMGYQKAFAHFGLTLRGEEAISPEQYADQLSKCTHEAKLEMDGEFDDALEFVKKEATYEAYQMVLNKLGKPADVDATAVQEHKEWLGLKVTSYEGLLNSGGDEQQEANWNGYLETLKKVAEVASPLEV